jgi:hypothetical protein
MRKRIWEFVWPFIWAKAGERGATRLERTQDWTADLAGTVRWFARYRVWRVPTRRWQGTSGSSRWPLPPSRAERRARYFPLGVRGRTR